MNERELVETAVSLLTQAAASHEAVLLADHKVVLFFSLSLSIFFFFFLGMIDEVLNMMTAYINNTTTVSVCLFCSTKKLEVWHFYGL